MKAGNCTRNGPLDVGKERHLHNTQTIVWTIGRRDMLEYATRYLQEEQSKNSVMSLQGPYSRVQQQRKTVAVVAPATR
jgi:hypothetical protein